MNPLPPRSHTWQWKVLLVLILLVCHLVTNYAKAGIEAQAQGVADLKFGKNYINYTFPLSGVPDKIPLQRVMSAFPQTEQPQQGDTGQQFVMGNSCPITSKITISRNDLLASTTESLRGGAHNVSTTNSSSSEWILSTWDINDNPKQVGGDDIYVTYTASGETQPTAIAHVTDLGNGHYTLQFVAAPTLSLSTNLIQKDGNASYSVIQHIQITTGRLQIWLEQSCGIGAMPPPLKNGWMTSGAINQLYEMDLIPAPQHVKTFVAPNDDGTIDLASFDQVVFLGDSLMGQFASPENYVPYIPFHTNIHKAPLVQAALNSQTLQQHFLNPIKTSIPQAYQKARLQHRQKSQSQQQESSPLRMAFILGSGVWDILADDMLQGGADFVDHLAACRALIASTRADFPNVTIFWKAMTAMHIHKVAVNPNWESIKRVYYMSNSRSRRLYDLQRNLMEELNVTVLDVYPATALSAHWTRLGDGRHYQPAFNQFVLEWFYPTNPPKH